MALLFYASISMLYAAGMLLIERILGSSRNRILIMLVYILILVLLFVPGLVLSIILDTTVLGPQFAYLLCVIWNVGISLLLVLLCRNILNGMELA